MSGKSRCAVAADNDAPSFPPARAEGRPANAQALNHRLLRFDPCGIVRVAQAPLPGARQACEDMTDSTHAPQPSRGFICVGGDPGERLLQLGEGGLDRVEVGEVLGRGRLLGVNNRAVLIDDDGGAGGGVADAGEAREHDVVRLGHGLVQVAQELDRDVRLPGPGLLRERAVDADAVDRRVQAFVAGDATGDVAHFLRADAGEGEGEEEQDGGTLAEVIAELDVFKTLGGLGFQGEVRGAGSDFEGHGGGKRRT